MGSSALDYLVGKMLARTENPRARRGWLMLSLGMNLGTLAFFKYFNFFITSAGSLLAWLGLPASVHSLNIILPVGISFYTFHSMSYTIDVYRGKMRAVSSLLDVAAFIGFFPQMVAGPIVRASLFLPQLRTLRKFEDVDVRGALVLFLTGLIKKRASLIPSRRSWIVTLPRPEISPPAAGGSASPLCDSSLLRFFRLYRHGTRFSAAARDMSCRPKFPFSVFRQQHFRFVAALAHQSRAGCAITFSFRSAEVVARAGSSTATS